MIFWKRPKFILWALSLVLVTVVVLQNVEPTQVDFFFWSLPSMPKLVLILISMVLGAIFALVAAWEFRARRSHREETHSDGRPATPTIH